jgi:signal transduction histidine kinase
VSNMTEASDQDGDGHGLRGMRRRLESVDGHLDVRRCDQPAGATFTVTAYLPLGGS